MDGGAIDGNWYLAVLGFARETPWLQGFMALFTNVGLVLLALLAVVTWWRMRPLDAARMAAALWVPLAVALAYGLSNLVKVLVQEPRPCIRYPAVPTVATCDYVTDYSFPSNHVTLAVAAAVALLFAARRTGLVALGLALLVAFSRMYLGAHYPHDVFAGAVLGALVACLGLPLWRPMKALVDYLRDGALRPLTGTGERTTVAAR
ncbi:phosphatase PAP2 family protein [Amycolatopsis sp. NBC_00348]|uniref:phosphatase PAP2 family protein n=1 Tax=Amycolatopsis sp. NBC_00348 TaxID=2975956 RepID=UPI002E25FAB7